MELLREKIEKENNNEYGSNVLGVDASMVGNGRLVELAKLQSERRKLAFVSRSDTFGMGDIRTTDSQIREGRAI